MSIVERFVSSILDLTGKFHLESVKKFEKAAVHYEKECLSLKSVYEDVEEQIRSTKVALENSYK